MIAVRERQAIVTAAAVNPRDFATVRPRHVAAPATVPQDPLAVCVTDTDDAQQRPARAPIPTMAFRHATTPLRA